MASGFAGGVTCAYSRHACGRTRYETHKYCAQHLLEDESSLFTSCEYISRTSKRKCPNPARRQKVSSSLPSFCNEHIHDLNVKQRHQKLKRKIKRKKKNDKQQTRARSDTKRMRLINQVMKHDGVNKGSSTSRSYDDGDNRASGSEEAEIHRPITDDWLFENSDDLKNDADWDDFDPVNNEVYEPLRYADVLTPEEVVATAQSKLIRLQSLYIEQFKRLFHLLKEKRRKYLHERRREDREEKSGKAGGEEAEESFDEDEIAALFRYRRRTGVEELLRRQQKKRRLEAAGSTSTAPVEMSPSQPRCAHVTNHTRCRESCLPYTKFCTLHILEDPHQLLYKKCHVENCPMPVCHLMPPAVVQQEDEADTEECYCLMHAPLPEMNLKILDHEQQQEHVEIKREMEEPASKEEFPAPLGKNVTPPPNPEAMEVDSPLFGEETDLKSPLFSEETDLKAVEALDCLLTEDAAVHVSCSSASATMTTPAPVVQSENRNAIVWSGDRASSFDATSKNDEIPMEIGDTGSELDNVGKTVLVSENKNTELPSEAALTQPSVMETKKVACLQDASDRVGETACSEVPDKALNTPASTTTDGSVSKTLVASGPTNQVDSIPKLDQGPAKELGTLSTSDVASEKIAIDLSKPVSKESSVNSPLPQSVCVPPGEEKSGEDGQVSDTVTGPGTNIESTSGQSMHSTTSKTPDTTGQDAPEDLKKIQDNAPMEHPPEIGSFTSSHAPESPLLEAKDLMHLDHEEFSLDPASGVLIRLARKDIAETSPIVGTANRSPGLSSDDRTGTSLDGHNSNNNCSKMDGKLNRLVRQTSVPGTEATIAATPLPALSAAPAFGRQSSFPGRGERKPSSADEEAAVVSLLSLCSGHPSDDNSHSSSTEQE